MLPSLAASAAKPPAAAVKFIIVKPINGYAGTPITITVEAQEKNNTIDPAYQEDVTLIADGSATGGGLVDIVNGVGAIQINDSVAEKINLSLADTQLTGLDVKSKEKVAFSAAPPASPSLGAGHKTLKTLSVAGLAFPGARIFLVAKDQQGNDLTKQEIGASGNGDFGIIDNLIYSNYYTYSLIVKDAAGRQAQVKVYNTDFINNNTIDIRDIFVPPTIAIARAIVTKGDFIKAVGYAFPNSKIIASLDDAATYETRADDKGNYQLLINTAELGFGYHHLRVKQENVTAEKESAFSLTRGFLISESTVPKADFNGDGKINISDWSVFLALWKQKDNQIDLNGDGQVDLSDLSMFLRAIKTQ